MRAVDGVPLHVAEGEVYVSCLGRERRREVHDLVEILEGHRSATSGSASRVPLGTDPGQAARELPRSHRHRAATIRGRGRADGRRGCSTSMAPTLAAVVTRRRLSSCLTWRRRPTGGSAPRRGGSSRRWLDLALGIVGRPALLFLDELIYELRPGGAANACQLVPPAALPRHHRAVDDRLPGPGRTPGRPGRGVLALGDSSLRACSPSSSAAARTKVGSRPPDGACSVEGLCAVSIRGRTLHAPGHVLLEFTDRHADPPAAVHELDGLGVGVLDRELVGSLDGRAAVARGRVP